ncbi:MAG TPA: DUF1573 domain-containing protein [Pirellulales bacterium]|nr:DUF1573 domain-containing protein [Pirellulales bacterium]
MKRATTAWVGAIATIGLAAPAVAQDWARTMFSETNYNFGTVAKDAKTEHRFVFKNLYRDPVHISGVRTSCGCTTPLVVRDTVPSLESGEIVAHFNTDRFSGQRGATLTVTIDKPMRAEVQLRVDGFIRTDVMVQPGAVNFGSVPQGTVLEQTVLVEYSGAGDWQATDVQSNSKFVEAKLLKPTSDSSRRSYKIFVKLREDAPPGYVQDQLTVLTNDPSTPRLPISIEGRVLPELAISPQVLVLGTVPLGDKVTKQVVLQAKRPFCVLGMSCNNSAFEFGAIDNAAKTWHLLPVTFVAHDAGKFVHTIHVQTDLGHTSMVELPVHVEVLALATK